MKAGVAANPSGSISTIPIGTSECRRRAQLWGLLILVAATLLIFANSIGNPFVYDDLPSIVENKSLNTIGLSEVFQQQRGLALRQAIHAAQVSTTQSSQ